MMTIFTLNPDRHEVWEIRPDGSRLKFRGRFIDKGLAILYMNGRLAT